MEELIIIKTTIKNKVTKKTTACYEPSLDYVVVKMPKWEFKKFKHVDKYCIIMVYEEDLIKRTSILG